MSAIGYVAIEGDCYRGQLTTATLNLPIEIFPNSSKEEGDKKPDFKVRLGNAVLGAGWWNDNKDGEKYLRINVADPIVLPDGLAANLGKANDQDDPNVMALYWSPARRK